MLEGDSLPPKECRVDLSLSLSGIFRVTITSCDGYSAPSLARGFMLRSVVLSFKMTPFLDFWLSGLGLVSPALLCGRQFHVEGRVLPCMDQFMDG